MAIGDTVNAGLMRIDTSAYERAGQANANANLAFGNALNQVAKGYIEGQEKRARADEIAGYLMNQGVGEKDAKAIAKNPFLQKEYQRKKSAEQDMKIEQGRLGMQAEQIASRERMQKELTDRESARYNDQQNRLMQKEEDQRLMARSLLSETTDPQVLEDYNQAQPGLFALGGDQGARNRFLEYQRDAAPKVLGAELSSSDFGRFAKEQGIDPILASNRVMQLQAAESQANKDLPSIQRIVNMQDGKGGFVQVGVDSQGNPLKSFGPPKPGGMYPTPEEERRAKILVGRTDEAMEFNKQARDNSNAAIAQAEQAQQALQFLPETTGGATSFINEMKILAESLNIDLPSGYQEDMANIGAFRQLTGQFLFNAMSNTKGAITEREMKLFRQISPDIDNSRAANKLMLELYVKAGDRARQRRDLIRDLQ